MLGVHSNRVPVALYVALCSAETAETEGRRSPCVLSKLSRISAMLHEGVKSTVFGV
jgi:hypothetical protein